MASISGATSSNMTSSLYNTGNIISGLASGLDTEGMIESLVKSYQTKINQLDQKVTKTQWKQDAYRSIISKLVGLSSKYTSYNSSTNLLSPSFFTNAVNVSPVSKNEKYLDMVTASGKSSSDVALNAVHQLATSAKYTTQGGKVLTDAVGSGTDITTKGLNFDSGWMELSSLDGVLTFNYGSKTVGLVFDEVKDAEALKSKEVTLADGTKRQETKAEALKRVIEDKLKDEKVTLSSGASVSAYDRIGVNVGEDGTISFTDKAKAGNSVYIARASGSINRTLGIGDLTNADKHKINSFTVGENTQLNTSESIGQYLSSRSSSMNMTLDGVTKSVELPEVVLSGNVYKIKDGDNMRLLTASNYADVLNKSVKDVFGDKVKVSAQGKELRFEVKEGSDLLVNTSVGDALGLGGTSASTYLSASKTLGDLFGKAADGKTDNLDDAKFVESLGLKAAYKKNSDGKLVLDEKGSPILDKDEKGNQKYALEINGKELKTSFSKNSTLNDVMDAINRESDVKVSYSKTTKEFLFTSKETGEGSEIEIGGGLAKALFGDGGIDTEKLMGRDVNDFLSSRSTITKGELTQSKAFSLKVDGKEYQFGPFTGQDMTDQKILEEINSKFDTGIRASFNEKGELTLEKMSPDEAAHQIEFEYKDMIKGNEFSLKVDGKEYKYGPFKGSMPTVQNLLNAINGSLDAGMKASFDKHGGLVVTKTGADGQQTQAKVEFGAGSLAERMMQGVKDYASDISNQSTYSKGQDAIFNVTINGKQMEMTRSTNSVDIDGLTINMEDTFNTKMNGDEPVKDKDGKFEVDNIKDAVTFKSTTDSDKIVDAVKAMINDYNTVMQEIKTAYATLPYQKSNGKFENYEPLTDDDRQGMSESAIERYEEKAKQGILFGDRNLSRLYDRMRNAFSPAGEDGAFLRAMGITTSYSVTDGIQAVTLDEDKLRAMLDSEPEKVAEVFTKTTGTGGVMQNLKNELDSYARTAGEPKGVLIQQAGSPLSSLSLLNNTWQKEIDKYNTQISSWQDKLANQVDRYTKQFTRLEQLINQMNSQSSALMGLMGNG